jgi:hypothetical protein
MALRTQRTGSLAQKAAEHPARELKATAPCSKSGLSNRLSDSRDEIKDFNWLLKELITPTSQTSIPHLVESAHSKYRDTMGL